MQSASFSELSANVVGFCRLLRREGFPIGPSEETDSLKALQLVAVADPEEFRLALRTVLTGNRREQEVFDRLFDPYWNGGQRILSSNVVRKMEAYGNAQFLRFPRRKTNRTSGLEAWLTQENQAETLPSYSPLEVLSRRDFSRYTDEEMAQAIQLIRGIARVLATQFSRRYRPATEHDQIDFRKTLRWSLRSAGEAVTLVFQKRSLRRANIILLCDVSGSMESYTHFLIAFLYGLQRAYGRIETFVFSTSLHRITATLKEKSLRRILDELSDTVPDWSGGTRIGQNLQVFLEAYGRALINKHTNVLILSDGWDTGQVDLLVESMKEIHRKAHRVLWLNPLLGNPAYEPICAGMAAALPYVDVLLPAHNIDSLRNVYLHLVSEWRRKRIRKTY